MFRRRLAAAAPVASTAALLAVPGVASGAQAGDRTPVRDVLVSNARLPSASNHQEVPAGPVDAEVPARADNPKPPRGSSSSLVAAAGCVVQQRRSSG